MSIFDKLAAVNLENKEYYLNLFKELIKQIKNKQYDFKDKDEKDYLLINEKNSVTIVPKELLDLFNEMKKEAPNDFLGFTVLINKTRVSCFGIPCSVLSKAIIETPKREFVATVYIVKEGKVLLTLNEKVNKWVPLGGHVKENELPHETVIREAKEESGFDIELINLNNELGNINQNFSINLDVIKPAHHHINLAYLAKITAGEQKSNMTDDQTPLKWFSIEELKNLLDIPDNVKTSGIKAIELSLQKSTDF